MRDFSDAEYYAYRANIERERADRADNRLVANIHRELANRYLEQSRQFDDSMPLMLVNTTAAS